MRLAVHGIGADFTYGTAALGCEGLDTARTMD
jgi:hypothetical protein